MSPPNFHQAPDLGPSHLAGPAMPAQPYYAYPPDHFHYAYQQPSRAHNPVHYFYPPQPFAPPPPNAWPSSTQPKPVEHDFAAHPKLNQSLSLNDPPPPQHPPAAFTRTSGAHSVPASQRASPHSAEPAEPSMELALAQNIKAEQLGLPNMLGLHQPLKSFPMAQPPQVNLPGSTPSSASMDSNITLWQFLLELLANNEHPDLIQWTNNDGEFKLLDAEAVARLWGVRKGKHQMNYDKLSRALRYYYDKNIIKKVNGQKFVYRFVVQPEQAQLGGHADPMMFAMQRQGQSMNPSLLQPQVPRQPHDAGAFFRPAGADADATKPLQIVQNSHSTPSPMNSTCSPGSVGSSSGVSSAGTSTSNLSDAYHHALPPQHQPPPPALSHSSRPSSTASTTHSAATNHTGSRKRKADSADLVGFSLDKIKIEPAGGGGAFSQLSTPTDCNESPLSAHAAHGLGSRRAKPKPMPLDLTGVSNVSHPNNSNNNNGSSNAAPAAEPVNQQPAALPTAPNNTATNNNNNNNSANNNLSAMAAANNLMAMASSPLLLQNSPLLNLYAAASLSSSFMNQASPLATFPNALNSPLIAAAMAMSPTVNNNHLSMFGNSLSALTTPIPTSTPQQRGLSTQQQQHFFQFPPPAQPSVASLANNLAAILKSPGLNSPFLSAMGLGTPTAAQKFTLSPDALKTPIPTIREG